MSLQIQKLSYALGAEITGIDLREPIDDKTFNEVHAAFLDHCVLLFRGQFLTNAQQIAFSRRFGELEIRDEVRKPDEHVAALLQRTSGGDQLEPGSPLITFKFPPLSAQVWHSDRSFKCVPTMASVLHAIELPEVGGDTMFSNMYLAYEALSDGMKKLIGGLDGIHPGSSSRIDNSTPERLAETKRLNPPVAQPLVRVHPETGRKSLFLEVKVKQIVGMTAEESKPLLLFLCEHAARPQFIYRHVWQKHDVLMWENRCTNHIAVADYDKTKTRYIEKTCVAGTPSGYEYRGPMEVSAIYDGPLK